MEQFFGGLVDRAVYSDLYPANARGAKAFIPSLFLAPQSAGSAGGQDASGLLAIPSGGTTTALGTVGTQFTGANYAAAPNNFGAIVTALVIKNLMEVLRDRTVILQEGSFIKASNVPGTNQLRYTVFGDLGPAEDLFEGIPPQTEGLAWDTQEFTGKQKGKLVAITDLAEEFSPFELYRIASEKIAWNAVDTAEKDALALVTGAGGITLAGVTADAAASITAAVVALKRANVPMFPDGTYHAFITPEEAAAVMNQTGEKGWLDTMKYANGTALLNAELGQFRGVRFIETNRIPVSASAKTIFFGPNAFIWGDYQTIRAYRVAPGGDHADPLAQRGLVGWKGMWGLKLNEFSGTPAIGPASNPTGKRWGAVDLTT